MGGSASVIQINYLALSTTLEIHRENNSESIRTLVKMPADIRLYRDHETDPLAGSAEVESGRESSNEICRKFMLAGVIAGFLLIIGIVYDLRKFHLPGGRMRPYEVQQINSEEPFQPKMSVLKTLDALNEMSEGSGIKSGCESTVIIIRHCEKLGPTSTDADGHQHCSYLGHERAHFLPTLFGGSGKWPVPSLLYALSPERKSHLTFRQIETIQPLATKYGLKINSDVTGNDQVVKDYFSRLSRGKMCGKVALVCWRQDLIAPLAEDLACFDCPSIYREDEFDEAWMLKFVYNVEGTAILNDKNTLESSAGGRDLKKKKHEKNKNEGEIAQQRTWSVYSSITKQNFDPLKFSNDSGDYGGSPVGGKWLNGNKHEL